MTESKITSADVGKHGVLTLGGTRIACTIRGVYSGSGEVLIVPDGTDHRGHVTYLNLADDWQFTPDRDPFPTENGVYMPAHVSLDDGPLVYVLYDGEWRATPNRLDVERDARYLHEAYGLVRLVREGDAS